MRALSWKEPFASLMLYGKVETRTWNTNYRGLVLICASQVGYLFSDVHRISGIYELNRIERMLGHSVTACKGTHGKAIAVGELFDCRPMTLQDESDCFVQYVPPWEEVVPLTNDEGYKVVIKQRFCHFYRNVRPIEPFDWKGGQGWRNVPQEIIDQIKFI